MNNNNGTKHKKQMCVMSCGKCTIHSPFGGVVEKGVKGWVGVVARRGEFE